MNNVLQKKLKWHGSKVSIYTGTIGNIMAYIPEFERRPFSVYGNNNMASDDTFKDMIVRIPNSEYESEIPVAVVSKKLYTLNSRVFGFFGKQLEVHGH